jgi:sigma-B regulation protein RsbU (phosphoserine phosphatase)
MQPPILDQVRTSLVEKRDGLRQWLSQTPPNRKTEKLGPGNEEAVTARLEHLDDSIALAEAGDLGRCIICHGTVDPGRLMVDYTAMVCLEHLSAEEASRLEREIELAQIVQQALLPGEVPNLPGVEIAAFTRPAHFVGGDYFDFLTFHTGDLAWAVGDVAGHGVAAGLQMAGVQALCRAVIPTHASPAEALDQIHRLFIHNSGYTTFVSLFLGAYTPSTRTLTYCNAGHNPPMVLPADRRSSVRWLNPTGAAIGLLEDGKFSDGKLILAAGDLLIMYTDGVVEASGDGRGMFGPERLVEAVTPLRSGSPADVVRAITRALEDFVGQKELSDDATIVACRIS